MVMKHHLHGPIRVITFDWGDTLVANYGMPYGFVHDRALQELAQALSAAGGTVSDEWIAACAGELHGLWVGTADPLQNPDNREFDYDALLSRWVETCGLGRQQPEVDLALRRYGQVVTDTICAFEDVESTLAACKGLGLRVGILSHVPWPGWACRDWYERRGWDDWVDFYSLSSEVGVIKPHPDHYQHCLDQAGCAAGEILHVGDHPQRDVEGGKAFGFQTALKVTQGIYADTDLIACDPHLAIAHVRELPAILNDLLTKS